MKTIIVLIALTVVTLGSSTTSYSQEQLDEVILSNKTTQVYVDDFSEFISLLESRYPKLHKQISKDDALRDVYYTTRKHTFNGYIADLPSVL